MEPITLKQDYAPQAGINVTYQLKPQEKGVVVSAEFQPSGSIGYKRWQAVLPRDRVELALKGLEEVGEASVSLDAKITRSSGIKTNGAKIKVGNFITMQGVGTSISYGETYHGRVRVNMRRSTEGLELIVEFEGMERPITGLGLPDGVIISSGKWSG